MENNIQTTAQIHSSSKLKILELSLLLRPLLDAIKDIHFILQGIRKNERIGVILPPLYKNMIEFQARHGGKSSSLKILAKLFGDSCVPFFKWIENWLSITNTFDIIHTDFEYFDPFHEFFIFKNTQNVFVVP